MYRQSREYSSLRDAGSRSSTMLMWALSSLRLIAIGVRNWWLKVNHFDYDATLPELCHKVSGTRTEHDSAGTGKAALPWNTVSSTVLRLPTRLLLPKPNPWTCSAADSIMHSWPGLFLPCWFSPGSFTLPIRANSPIREKEGCGSCFCKDCNQRRSSDECDGNSSQRISTPCSPYSVWLYFSSWLSFHAERLFTDLLCTRLCRPERHQH